MLSVSPCFFEEPLRPESFLEDVSRNHVESNTSSSYGGGVYNGGVLYLDGVTITGNAAPLFSGGGLSNEGRAELKNCTMTNNTAQWGGGVSNSNNGTLTIWDSVIRGNKANQGYGGLGNAGVLTLYDTIVTENTARRLGGGLGNNAGTVTLCGTEPYENISADAYNDLWTNSEGAVTRHNTIFVPAGLNIVPVAPVYEISGPATGALFAKTLTHWEFSAVSLSFRPIRDWEIDWGDGSDVTEILGGPRSRVSVAHDFREAGTYTITIRTTDFDGVVNTITIGTYEVKAKVMEPLVMKSFVWVEPELAFGFDALEFSLPEEPALVSFAAPLQFGGENRMENDLADLTETMRQRQMLDLDQQRSSGQKSDGVTFPDLVWADDALFGDEWIPFTDPETDDFWNEMFEEVLLTL